MIDLHMKNGEVMHIDNGITFEDVTTIISKAPIFWQIGDAKCVVRVADISAIQEVDDDANI